MAGPSPGTLTIADIKKLQEEIMQQAQMEELYRLYRNSPYGGYNGLGRANQALYGGPFGQSGYGSLTGISVFAIPRELPKPREIPREGIRAGEIVAYRCWQLSKSKRWLKSATADKIWQPGETMEGDVEKHGVHCFKYLSQADEYCVDHLSAYVIGSVEIWGEVVEHKNGYRAQYAKIKSLEYLVNFHEQTVGWGPWKRKAEVGKLVMFWLRKTYGV